MSEQGAMSARWVPDDYGQYWRACSTQRDLGRVAPKHPPVPPWLTNAMYDSRTKETWWQFFVRVSGLDEAMRRRQAFLDGFTDTRGNWWCGQCSWRARLIEAGEALGYPDMHPLSAHPDTRERTGYANWLDMAQRGSAVLVETAARAALERAKRPETDTIARRATA